MNKHFTVPGEARGKGRPRFGNGRTYTDSKTVEYENLVRACFYTLGDTQIYEGPVKLELEVCCQVPKSEPKYTKRLMVDGMLRPTKRPDVDNIAKIIMDALNGVAYRDDAQVVELAVKKKYVADDPCVVVCLTSC